MMDFEISLRPYPGRLFVAPDRKAYLAAYSELFGGSDVLDYQKGRFYGQMDKKGLWTYLIFADDRHTMVHEVTHLLLDVFERCGIDPRAGNGEPFCYMLSQILLDIWGRKKKW